MNPYSHFSIAEFDRFLVWLATSDLRLFFYRAEGWDPFVVFLHVLGASVLFGAILLMDLRLIGRARQLGVHELAALAVPWAMGGAALALITGIVLLLFDPIAVGIHTFFLPKMALIVLGLANALLFHRFAGLDTVDAPRGQLRARISGVASIAVWMAVFLCAALNARERISSSSAVAEHVVR